MLALFIAPDEVVVTATRLIDEQEKSAASATVLLLKTRTVFIGIRCPRVGPKNVVDLPGASEEVASP